ncbi:MAG: FHA domain-containing protein [Clostridia bacterium]|nr:FHA domain-containing protein [Clostridia bacterium]
MVNYTSNLKMSSDRGACLTIIDRDRTIRTVPLTKSEMFVGTEGDIILNSRIVSRWHGKFTQINREFYYNDEGSLNGTLINGEQIGCGHYNRSQRYRLENGDVIKITVPESVGNPENVMMIFSERMSVNTRWKYISLKDKPNHELEIGRNVPQGELCIDSVKVSEIHAKIVYWPDRVFIVDKESQNGVIVNGKRITESCFLNNYDVVSIANTKLIYIDGMIYFNIEPDGIKMEVHDISKVVQKNKTVSDHVSFTVYPCEMVAVIGGSVEDRTIFMNCINGSDRATSGAVFMDGMNLYDNYNLLKSRIGNIPKKYELYDYLSVYGSLKFTADSQLAKDISKQERVERIEKVIQTMGLSEQRKTLIKKLSDGQKKSMSIAKELVSNPDIIFLDEPNAGLDPEAETILMKQLKNLSLNSGKTIILTPSTLQNIHLFDKIIFLAPEGKLCYCGSPTDALSFFEVTVITDAYEKVRNNADYFIRKYNNSL